MSLFFFGVSSKVLCTLLVTYQVILFCNCTCVIFIRTRTNTHGITELQSKWYCEIKLSLKLAATYQEMVRNTLHIRKCFQVFFVTLESEKIEPVNRLRPKAIQFNFLVSSFLMNVSNLHVHA